MATVNHWGQVNFMSTEIRWGKVLRNFKMLRSWFRLLRQKRSGTLPRKLTFRTQSHGGLVQMTFPDFKKKVDFQVIFAVRVAGGCNSIFRSIPSLGNFTSNQAVISGKRNGSGGSIHHLGLGKKQKNGTSTILDWENLGKPWWFLMPQGSYPNFPPWQKAHLQKGHIQGKWTDVPNLCYYPEN